MLKIRLGSILGLFILFGAGGAHGAGSLTPRDVTHAPIQILDHHVNVTINNGFAQTEVVQTFFNPNDVDLPPTPLFARYAQTKEHRYVPEQVIRSPVSPVSGYEPPELTSLDSQAIVLKKLCHGRQAIDDDRQRCQQQRGAGDASRCFIEPVVGHWFSARFPFFRLRAAADKPANAMAAISIRGSMAPLPPPPLPAEGARCWNMGAERSTRVSRAGWLLQTACAWRSKAVRR